jgi:FkbM family methyltransferase
MVSAAANSTVPRGGAGSLSLVSPAWLDWHRRRRFYRWFVKRGDLCFDVGANVGSRTEIFLALGARVVAVEPQSGCYAILRQRFSVSDRFVLEPVAVGAEPGHAELRLAEASALATLSADWRQAVQQSGRFANFHWDITETVEVSTLDILIDRHGTPAFCKIDVEGYESEVLAGLSVPIQALSFEFVPERLGATTECVERLLSLGSYEFNYSLGESLRLADKQWLSPGALLAELDKFRADAVTFGDVYARTS